MSTCFKLVISEQLVNFELSREVRYYPSLRSALLAFESIKRNDCDFKYLLSTFQVFEVCPVSHKCCLVTTLNY